MIQRKMLSNVRLRQRLSKTAIHILRCQLIRQRELHPLNQLEVTEKHMMKNIKTGQKVIIM